MSITSVSCHLLDEAKDLGLPLRHSEEAVGFDLYVHALKEQAYTQLTGSKRPPKGEWLVTVLPGMRVVINTGFCLEVPLLHAGLVFPRSGNMAKGLLAPPGVGVVDPDYRGPIYVPLLNLTGDILRLNRGDRIAQLVIVPVHSVALMVVDKLSDSVRGVGGLGSTGVR